MRVNAGPIKHQAKNGMNLNVDRELTEGEVEFIAGCIEQALQEPCSTVFVEWSDEGGPITVGWMHDDDRYTIYRTTFAPKG